MLTIVASSMLFTGCQTGDPYAELEAREEKEEEERKQLHKASKKRVGDFIADQTKPENHWKHSKLITKGDKFKGTSSSLLSGTALEYEWELAPLEERKPTLPAEPATNADRYPKPDEVAKPIKFDLIDDKFGWGLGEYIGLYSMPEDEDGPALTAFYIQTPSVLRGGVLPLLIEAPEEVRDNNKNVYIIEDAQKIYNPVNTNIYIYDFDIAIPVKRLVELAESNQSLTLKVYGKGTQLNRRVSYHILIIVPDWYIKGYVFSLLHHKWIAPQIAGKQLTDEFNRIKSSETPAEPKVPENANSDKVDQ